MIEFNKKLIFRKFFLDNTYFFIISLASLSIIVWVIQAVNFLDFVTEDGHGLLVYLNYTLLSLPKIISRLMPFIFFISIFESITFEGLQYVTFDLIDAAGFVLTYGTSYHALFDRAQFSEGETILVLGASGGVGLAAIQLSKIQGLKVIAAASTDNKLNICKENGADFLINYKDDDIRKKVKEFVS